MYCNIASSPAYQTSETLARAARSSHLPGGGGGDGLGLGAAPGAGAAAGVGEVLHIDFGVVIIIILA